MRWFWQNVLYLLPVGVARWFANVVASVWSRTVERWTEPEPPAFLPSWVRIDPEGPFAGAFATPEEANAMAFLVCAHRARGDAWRPMTKKEFELALVGATQIERVFGVKARMPADIQALAPIAAKHRCALGGIPRLMDGGYCWVDGDKMTVAPRGLRVLARFAEMPLRGGGAR